MAQYLADIVRLYKFWTGAGFIGFIATIVFSVPKVQEHLGYWILAIPPTILVASAVIVFVQERARRSAIRSYWAVEEEVAFLLEIQNVKGDLAITANRTIYNRGKKTIWILPPLTLSLDNKAMPSLPQVSDGNLDLLVNYSYYHKGSTYHAWHYIAKKGVSPRDSIKYTYGVAIPGSEAKAFTDNGNLFGASSKTGSIVKCLRYTLNTPYGYKINAGDVEVTDEQGTKNVKETRRAQKLFKPSLDQFGRELNWIIKYPLPNHDYTFPYWLKPQPGSAANQAQPSTGSLSKQANDSTPALSPAPAPAPQPNP
jgi:hypothetical protein